MNRASIFIYGKILKIAIELKNYFSKILENTIYVIFYSIL